MPQSAIENKSIFLIVGADKIVHFLMYAFLMYVWAKSFGFIHKKWMLKNWLIIGLIYCFCLGLVLEIVQYYTFLGRSLEFFDIVANISGSLLVFIIFKYKNF